MSSKRTVIAIVAAVAAFGAISASAAGLGGITGSNLGAETKVVAACDTGGITAGYTTVYNVPTKEYVVSEVKLTNVDAACGGATATVTLAKNTAPAAVLGAGNLTSVTVTAGAVTVPMTPATIPAKDVEQIAIVIAG